MNESSIASLDAREIAHADTLAIKREVDIRVAPEVAPRTAAVHHYAVDRDKSADKPDQLVENELCYAGALIDAFSRRVKGGR